MNLTLTSCTLDQWTLSRTKAAKLMVVTTIYASASRTRGLVSIDCTAFFSFN